MLRFWLVILLLLVVHLPAKAANDPFKSNVGMKIHFYEFQIVTYAPITLEEIFSQSEYQIDFYERHKFIKKMKNMLTSSPTKKPFDYKNVRLAVEILVHKKTINYAVDTNGVVLLLKSKKLYQLSRNNMESLQNSILGFHGVVDRRPDFNPEGPLSE